MLLIITGLVILLFGLAVAALGVQLTMVGGSPFYIIMGLGLIVSGFLLLRKKASGLWIYAFTLILTFIWTLYEVGFDKWQWIPRGVILVLLGLWLCLPFVSRPIKNNSQNTKPASRLLGGSLLVIILLAVVSWFIDPATFDGELPQNEKIASTIDPSRMAGDDWVAYGGSNLGQRYSTLKDIDTSNVGKLKLAWEHHTGDFQGKDDSSEYTFEVNPLKVNNTIYSCTPHNIVEALDPVTGKLKWRYDPRVKGSVVYEHQTCRGVSYHEDKQLVEGNHCPRRIIATTGDARMFAVNADNGEICSDFGNNGFVNLMEHQPNQNPDTFMMTSPAVISHDLAIIGGAIADNYYVDNPSGVIRAYDVHNGQLVWKWDAQKPNETKPLEGDATYEPGSPNAWTVMAADDELGLVYVPLGNKSPDQFGAKRSAEVEKFTAALVALDVKTGELRWSFKSINHDLWDRDLPSQPVLLDLDYQGKNAPAIIVPTKGGNLWVLDRRDGTPIYPVHEEKVSDKSDIKQETPAGTQPISALNFIPPVLEEKDMWGITPIDQMLCRITYRQSRYDRNPFTPPSLEGSIIYPGNTGIFNWGSVAVDPENQYLFGTPVNMAFRFSVYPRPDFPQNADERMVSTGPKPSGENLGGPFAVKLNAFLSPLGIPCQSPPWGLRVGVDLASGKTAWQQRNGSVEGQEFAGQRFPIPLEMGTISLGGPLITAGGIVFMAGTADSGFRAYELKTGKLLWETRLPAGGQSTPMSYRGADGKQYILVAAGGHGSMGSPMGDSILAYTLEP
ncbi:membrane-bound PQQ-dependent dehydrogenase, glucose/quinate/shikimate family [Bartonella sp. HY329]|uniref:membrane-bound PQQ-dependent dehydrogenase, glucose/quinate/shikimate family n=1 Tax=unclassified Bartonella TaxID=2645622 RepID=UPI0021C61E54|nr:MULTISPECIES: membrane-bound PQQ-dependent dehydrogenase, glucose/quinate/shikimate family [unclassified Bartonella]UXM95391.1 membrane-bound PQQ-dependent dehydrogenase, glucose/quinate/shikimate family [Bartonella sp. HY329]UXN09716.1 membrane-bound PQQ-dependent dehydrogenase, glucose/quinate/shikimate family [Bartonella sp. HY328]